jgi:hypothetical protein
MNRKTIRKYYSDFLEGNLEQEDRKRFLEILRSDPELQADYDLFARTRNMVTQLPYEEAEPDFEQIVLERLHDERDDREGFFWRAPWLSWQAVSVAAVLSLAIVAVSLFVNRPAEDQDTPLVPVAGINLELANQRPDPGQLPPSLRDPVLVSRIDEISSLINEIETLRNQYARGGEEVILGEGSGQEFVFRPDEFYRRALKASRERTEVDPSLQHANAY